MASTSKHNDDFDDEDFDLDDIKLGDDDDDFDEPMPKSGGKPKKTKTLAEVLNKKKFQALKRESINSLANIRLNEIISRAGRER